jgi:hypothetical protein
VESTVLARLEGGAPVFWNYQGEITTAGVAEKQLTGEFTSQACRQKCREISPILGPGGHMFMTGIVHKGAITSFFLFACELCDYLC